MVRNTLERNGSWVSSKTLTEDGLMGAHSFMRAPSSLAQRRVNLGRWHGFQELTYREPLTVREASCDIRLDDGEYGVFLFNGTDVGMSGLRLSHSPQFASVYFTALWSGEFLSTQPIDTGSWRGDRWAHLRVEFGDDRFIATLDGHALANVETPIAVPQRVGMRGCYRRTLVDNFQIESTAGEFEETFDRPGDFWRAALLALFVFGAIDALAFRAVRRGGSDPRRALFRMLMLGIVAALSAGATLYVCDRMISNSYMAHMFASDVDFRVRVERERRRNVRQQHTDQPASGVTRVLMMGSSQTAGEGASRRRNGLVQVIQRELGSRFEVINAGMRGLKAARIAFVFEEDWSRLAPHIVVVNLGNNDDDVGLFREALSMIASRCRAVGAKLLLVQEANTTEHDCGPLRQRHAAMAEVAAQSAIPVVPSHDYMSKQVSRGLLWWDTAHPTDFGHRLIGRYVAPEIRKLAN